MRHKILPWEPALLVFCLAAGCSGSSPSFRDPAVVAVVDGLPVTRAEVGRMAGYLESRAPRGADLRAEALERLIDRRLLLHAARARKDVAGVSPDTSLAGFGVGWLADSAAAHGADAAEAERLRSADSLITGYVKATIADLVRISDRNMMEYLAQNPKRFAAVERMKVEIVSVPLDPSDPARPRRSALAALDEARRTGDLSVPGRPDSMPADRTAEFLIDWDDDPSPLERAAVGLDPGQWSDLIEVGGAVSFLRVVEKEVGSDIPFEPLRPAIFPVMKREQVAAALAARLKHLRKDASIRRSLLPL